MNPIFYCTFFKIQSISVLFCVIVHVVLKCNNVTLPWKSNIHNATLHKISMKYAISFSLLSPSNWLPFQESSSSQNGWALKSIEYVCRLAHWSSSCLEVNLRNIYIVDLRVRHCKIETVLGQWQCYDIFVKCRNSIWDTF